MLPMQKSRYRAKAVSWQLGEASTGTPQVGVEFEVQDGENQGERISGYFALSDAAAEYTLEKLRNCGWTGTDIGELDGPGASASMKANVVELVVEPEQQVKNGAPVVNEDGSPALRLRIQFVNRGGGLAMKTTLTEDKKKLLAAKMRGKLAALDAKARRDGPVGNGATGPVSPEPPPHSGPVDDIPF